LILFKAGQMDYQKYPKAEIQDIFAGGLTSYLEKYPTTKQQRKALFSIVHCRSPLLGKHIDKCDRCGHLEISCNSCRNRHCPKCQAAKQYHWVAQLESSLPPVRYFHLVFTLPHELNELVYKYQKHCYSLMFKASAQSVLKVASGPDFLGVQSGCLSVLHTWGQNLQYHPHIHMLVPAGGLSEDLLEWIPCGKKFFAPVKVLSRVFRGKFLALLEDLITRGIIQIDLTALKTQLYAKEWVVYSKKTFAGPAQVLQYLGKYTHRIAISNSRIVTCNQGKVTFRWKDYRDGNRWKIMQLDSLEFMRRFLLHVLPANFYKIRYYGLFALAHRKQMLGHCMKLIVQQCLKMNNLMKGLEVTHAKHLTLRICPVCHTGTLKFRALLPSASRNGT
jgi:hypothetical protein